MTKTLKKTLGKVKTFVTQNPKKILGAIVALKVLKSIYNLKKKMDEVAAEEERLNNLAMMSPEEPQWLRDRRDREDAEIMKRAEEDFQRREKALRNMRKQAFIQQFEDEKDNL